MRYQRAAPDLKMDGDGEVCAPLYAGLENERLFA
jgi:hypothetical protein